MKLKKWISLALAGALSLSLLAGCQNNTPAGGSSGTPADQSQPQAGAQVPEGDAAQDQFFRQMTPNTTSFDQAASAAAMGEVMADVKEMTGQKSIFVTHSQGGAVGWDLPVENIAAIVAIEPGGTPQPGSEQYQRLLDANIPVVVYFGDYIDNGPEGIASTGFWKMMRDGALAFAEQYNADGGSATVVDLPKEGITGNSHFMFQELNNDVIADHVEAWIQANVSPDGGSETVVSNPTGSEGGRTLVAYYSASGNTQVVAQTIAGATSGDLFEIVPAEAYSSADLDWTDKNSRVSKEHDDLSLRNVALTADTVDNWDEYDTVFIGYPIWWGIAAWPVDTFIKANDFTGKTVIPFCTSSSSGLGESGELLAQLAGTGDWQKGQRFRSGVSETDVTDWVNGLGFQ